ncbi:MAG: hypothetical protein HKL96_07610 [Phycisphaerales bacterium]|nr:hypothetical protein [Phycisphaerales bacterium]
MKLADAVTTNHDYALAAANIAEQLRNGLTDAPADLVTVFVTMPLQPHFADIMEILQRELKPRHLLACTAESVLGRDLEVERTAAISAMALSLPGATLDSFHFADEEWPELLGEPTTLHARLEAGSDLRLFIMLGDPFTTPVVQLLDACSREFPSAPVMGGMASGARQPGLNRLAVNDRMVSSGVVGVSIAGPLQVDCVVSQGCRPIGPSYAITQGHDNLIERLDDIPPLQVIARMLEELAPDDRQLVEQRGLQIGRVIDERKDYFGRGDFLVRNIVGMQRQTGALAIGDVVHSGQTVQFHVQDQQTADEDLKLLLQGELLLASPPSGLLMFSCNGRGTQLFGSPHHDVKTVRSVLGPLPVAGFFCAGEFGPVGGRNFIHGQTVSLALFR